MIETLGVLPLLLFLVYQFNQITILHMPQQLSCCGMCKIVTWLDNYFPYNSSLYYYNIWTVYEMVPCATMYNT